MSLKIGGSKTSGKTSSTETQNQNTNSNSTSTSTPNVPDWIAEFTKNLTGKAGGLSDLDPKSLVAGVNPLTSQASMAAGGLSGSPWNFDAATDITRGVAGSATPQVTAATTKSESLLDGLDSFFSPYKQKVIDAALGDFDIDRGKTRAQQVLDEASASAFGDSGAALARGFTEGELGRARGGLEAGLLDEGFKTAAGLSSQDASRRQAANDANANFAQSAAGQNAGLTLSANDQRLRAGGQLADLSTTADDNTRANIATQTGLGDILRGIETEGKQAPFAQLQSIIEMLNGLGLGNFIGQTSTGSQNSTGTSTGTASGTSSGKGLSFSGGYAAK